MWVAMGEELVTRLLSSVDLGTTLSKMEDIPGDDTCKEVNIWKSMWDKQQEFNNARVQSEKLSLEERTP